MSLSIMAIESSDLFTMQLYMFLFIGGIMFTILAFLVDWPKKLVFHLIAMNLLFPLGFLIMGTGLDMAIVVSLVFWGLGVINLLSTLFEGSKAMFKYRNKRWE